VGPFVLLEIIVQSVGLLLVALIFSWPAIYPWLQRFLFLLDDWEAERGQQSMITEPQDMLESGEAKLLRDRTLTGKGLQPESARFRGPKFKGPNGEIWSGGIHPAFVQSHLASGWTRKNLKKNLKASS
jgi:hypothetical protein